MLAGILNSCSSHMKQWCPLRFGVSHVKMKLERNEFKRNPLRFLLSFVALASHKSKWLRDGRVLPDWPA